MTSSEITIKNTHHIPTPTASDHIERKSTSKEKLNFETNKSVSLDRWAKMFPTPQANEDLGNSPEVRNTGEGTLNPQWVSWLMGYPTDYLEEGQPDMSYNPDIFDQEPEGIPRVTTGIKDRANKLKALGNSIVPQVAFEIFKAIDEKEKGK